MQYPQIEIIKMIKKASDMLNKNIQINSSLFIYKSKRKSFNWFNCSSFKFVVQENGSKMLKSETKVLTSLHILRTSLSPKISL